MTEIFANALSPSHTTFIGPHPLRVALLQSLDSIGKLWSEPLRLDLLEGVGISLEGE